MRREVWAQESKVFFPVDPAKSRTGIHLWDDWQLPAKDAGELVVGRAAWCDTQK
jgi:hypothetical protein